MNGVEVDVAAVEACATLVEELVGTLDQAPTAPSMPEGLMGGLSTVVAELIGSVDRSVRRSRQRADDLGGDLRASVALVERSDRWLPQ